MPSVFNELNETQLTKILALGQHINLSENEEIFVEGDQADYLYFICSGQVSIFIQKFNTVVEIQLASSGDWFGEVAVYSEGYRTASAKTISPAILLRITRADFHKLLTSEPEINEILGAIIEQRNLNLVLTEKMMCIDCGVVQDVHIGIKGDPSLRESAMERTRYNSIVDRNLPELLVCFEELLLNRSAHRLMIGCNNGDIRVSTIFDPMAEEFHPATRLMDKSYVDRHFPKISYEHKSDNLRNIYKTILREAVFSNLPPHLHQGYVKYINNWEPVSKDKISKTISKLGALRSIPNFYIRNITINIMKDIIHMQFNCDGTHIVSALGFERFIEENF